jgi:glutathione synthase/RimK-type ligase-like ATP-grasp enzyme
MPHLTIATCANSTTYSQEPDDALLQAALNRAGMVTDLVPWDDPNYDWSRPDLVLLRSTWDYPARPAAFLSWMEGVSQLTTLWNPAHLVRWNLQKTYLLDLHLRGVPIIPTLWLPAKSPVALASLMHAHNWSQVVIKPVIGTSSREAHVVSLQTVEAGQQHLSRLLEREAVMVQPFLPTFYATGEHSLIFINGVFTHAMRKRFTLMEGLDQAGQQSIQVSEEEQAFAREVLQRLPTVPLYARVDLVRDHRHTLVLNELELIEPVLYLSHAHEALSRLTKDVSRLTRQAQQQRVAHTKPLHQHGRQGRHVQETLPLVVNGVGDSSVSLLSRR